MKASPKTTSTNPADALEQELVAEEAGAEQLRADAERDEDGREAEDERDARERRRGGPSHGPRAGRPRRPRRPRGTRDEREHAGARKETKPATRATKGSVAVMVPSNRASSSSTRRSSSGSSGLLPASPGRRGCRLHVHASTATATAPARARRAAAPRRAGRTRASEARRARRGRTGRRAAALISAALSPAAIRARMYAFIRVAIGEFDWSSVILQVGQTISASRSACFGGPPAAVPASASAISNER